MEGTDGIEIVDKTIGWKAVVEDGVEGGDGRGCGVDAWTLEELPLCFEDGC